MTDTHDGNGLAALRRDVDELRRYIAQLGPAEDVKAILDASRRTAWGWSLWSRVLWLTVAAALGAAVSWLVRDYLERRAAPPLERPALHQRAPGPVSRAPAPLPRAGLIVDILRLLDEDYPPPGTVGYWTRDGRPSVAGLERELGVAIPAWARDAAWSVWTRTATATKEPPR